MEGAAADFPRFAPDIHRGTKTVDQIQTINTMYGAAPAIQPQHLVPEGTREQAVNVTERTPLAAFLWMLRGSQRGMAMDEKDKRKPWTARRLTGWMEGANRVADREHDGGAGSACLASISKAASAWPRR